MCGFIGQVNFEKQSFEWIKEGLKAISHRGPDSSGTWISDCSRVALGHQRLSILDLSEKGNQPMHNKEFGLTIVFNGEIYNHKEIRKSLTNMGFNNWKGTSDTETILISFAILGFEKTLSKMIGMFSLLIYCKKSNKIFLARDRAGEKPLFYHFNNSCFIASSELKAIFKNKKIKRYLSLSAFNSYLENGFVPGKNCILKDFKKLEPGHFASLDINSGKLDIKRYWQLPKFQKIKSQNKNETEFVEEIEYLLNQSVKNQLYADVDVGVLLSGGVDSSLITAIASKYNKKLKTFTIKFDDKKFDESSHAKLIAEHFQTDHTELKVQPSSIEIIELLSRQFDEPMVDSSMIPTYFVTNLVRKRCKVALGGDGADELFGGYQHYPRNYKLKKYLEFCPSYLKKILIKTLPYIGNLSSPYSKINKLKSLVEYELIYKMPKVYSLFGEEIIIQLINKISPKYSFSGSLLNYSTNDSYDYINILCAFDFYNYLAEDILVKTDRTSMLNSLELRSPFLDHRIIEFAFRDLPTNLKIKNNEKKIILKRLSNELLPKGFDLKRKQGFSIPLDKWLTNGIFREYVEDILYSMDTIFPKKTINKLLEYQDKGFNCGEKIFALTQFEIWRKAYKISI